jgi:hypothetical protein
MRTFFALIFVVLSGSAHAADQRIAVLELRGAVDGQVLRLMTDEVRGGVLDAVGDGEFMVMTRENMAVIAKDMGKDLSCLEGECEVETARNIGAAYVVSGEVISVAGTLNMVLKLHDTEQGALRSKRRISASNVQGLIDDAQSLAAALTRDGLRGGGSAVPTVSAVGETEIQTGATADYATLATQAAKAKAAREQGEAELAEQARIEAAAREAERRRLAELERRAAEALADERQRRFEVARDALLAKASSDFSAIKPLLEMNVTDETRPVLSAFLDEYEDASVRIDDAVLAVVVPGVEEVQEALGRPTALQRRELAEARSRQRKESVGVRLVMVGTILPIAGAITGIGAGLREEALADDVRSLKVDQSEWAQRQQSINKTYIVGYSLMASWVPLWLIGGSLLPDPATNTSVGVRIHRAW